MISLRHLTGLGSSDQLSEEKQAMSVLMRKRPFGVRRRTARKLRSVKETLTWLLGGEVRCESQCAIVFT